PNVWGGRLMAAAGFPEESAARSLLDHERHPDVGQVRPMSPAVPPRAGRDLGSGLFVAGVASIAMQAWALSRANAGPKTPALSSGRGHQAVERGHPRG